MRGGLQTIPINQGDVYFSDQMIANHAAENFVWIFAKSASYDVHGGENPFVKMEMAKAKQIVENARKRLVFVDSLRNYQQLLSTQKSNVVVMLQ